MSVFHLPEDVTLRLNAFDMPEGVELVPLGTWPDARTASTSGPKGRLQTIWASFLATGLRQLQRLTRIRRKSR
jgi:hypothetical protein